MSHSLKRWILIFLLFVPFLFYHPEVVGTEEPIRDELPEWLERVYYGLKVESDRKPFFYFETVQPLWRRKGNDSLIFTQPRITIKEGRNYYSFGLGYRHLFGLDKSILGFNVFYDWQEGRHRQVGLGAESLGNNLEARINYYLGTSNEQLVEETATYFKYEEVVDGLDAEIGIRVPRLSWMKVFAGGYYYDANYSDDLQGWKTRLELKPLRCLTLDVGAKNDNSSQARWFVEAQWHISFGEEDSASKETLYSRMLDPVERNFMPTLEKWTSDKTSTVTGRILDQNGRPVINAKVEIHSDVVTVYTDSNGEFNAVVPVGNHTLYAWNSDDEPIITGEAVTVTDATIPKTYTYNVNNPAVNYAPEIGKIQGQTIDEGETFDPINLDECVSDPEDDDSEISWSSPGSSSITVSISNRVATLSTPSVEWSGSETITFTATDSKELSSSYEATFTVTAVNDPPVISNLTADPTIITGHPSSTSQIEFDVTDVDGDDINWSASITEFIPKQGQSQQKGELDPVSGTIYHGSGSGELTYDPPQHDGTAKITIELDDGNGGTASDFIDIEVDHKHQGEH